MIKLKVETSEFGTLPNGWEIASVETFLQNKKGALKIGPFGSQLKKETFVEDGIKVYGQENIFEKSMSYGNRYITHVHFEKLKTCELHAGDFIVSMMGTIGKCMVVPKGIKRGIMDSHLLRLKLNHERINSKYLSHLFSSPLINDQVNKLAVGGIMAGLSVKIVKEIKFILPPIIEQQKIANILGVVDKKIYVIEEQIKVAEELKKGLMQQLLTKGIGHTKFKDSPLGNIPNSWEVKSLGEFGAFSKGKGISKSELSETGYPCIRYGEIYTTHHFIIKRFNSFISNEVSKNSTLINKGDILFTGSGETVEEIGKAVAFIGEETAYAGGDIIIFSPDDVNSIYLSYCLNSEIVIAQRRKYGQGNAVVHIYSASLAKLLIPISSKEEQNQIATILCTVDEKIELLNQKRDVAIKLKQGLMQQLLTGKIRIEK